MFTGKPKALSSILSSFNKTIEELAVLQQFNADSIVRKEELIADLEADARNLREENERAEKIQDKIKNLVS